MASNIGPTQGGNTPFKKRALRPWKPAFSSDESPRQAEIHTEFLQKHLETSLEIKTQQQEALQEQLSMIENSPVTVGGFFQPSNILLLQSKDFFQKTNSLFGELKDKEHEILEITQQLKLTQAEEEAKRAYSQCQAEEAARHIAEEKAFSALYQAQQATEQAKRSEEKVYQANQMKGKLEQTIVHLEEMLKVKDGKYSSEVQEAIKNLESVENARAIETELRKRMQQELHRSTAEFHIKETALYKEIEASQHEITLLNAQWLEDHQKTETELYQITQALHFEHERTSQLEQKTMVFHEKMEQMLLQQKQIQDEKEALENEMRALHEQFNKSNAAIECERDLRKLFEGKIRETASQIFTLEMRLQAEEYARQCVEEKSKRLIAQASQAVLQVFEAN